MLTASKVLKAVLAPLMALGQVNDLYNDEPPSALRAYKKIIADDRTNQILAYFRVFPEALKEPLERFIEREGHIADIALDRLVNLEEWMFELQENGGPTFNIYHLPDVVGPCSKSYMVLNGMQGFVIEDPIETKPCVSYYRRSKCGAGDLTGALRPYFHRVRPISRG